LFLGDPQIFGADGRFAARPVLLARSNNFSVYCAPSLGKVQFTTVAAELQQVRYANERQ
jgi:hypothetical protein